MGVVHLVKEEANGTITTFCGLRGREHLTKQVYAQRGGDCFVAVQPTDVHKGANCQHCRRITNGLKKKATKHALA